MPRKKSKKNSQYTGRFYSLVVLLGLLVGVLVWRLVNLTIVDRQFLQSQGDARSIRVIDIPAYRGMIKDRNGEPLAVSSPVQSIWANPKDFDVHSPKLTQLAKLLERPVADIVHQINKSQTKEFVYLKRGLEPDLALKIKALNIPGVNLQKEFRRYYPEGEVVSHVLGVTNIDDQGQEGLELYYNDWLRGVPGKKRVLKDRMGHVVQDISLIQAPSPGHDLTVSLDRRIQFLAYRELKDAVTRHKATSGSLVVLDIDTGEILAMVNQPSYNPNNRVAITMSQYRNRAVTDMFEPGSVIKPFSIASALDTHQFSSQTRIDTNPGWMMVAGKTVRDLHNYGDITVSEVLQHSSNIGVTKMILASPPQQLWSLLHRVGFGQSTGIGFPGEAPGSLSEHRVWSPFVLATLGFGYGVSVTTLQLARSYAVFGHSGKIVPTTLLLGEKTGDAKEVLQPQIAKEMLDMLTEVVENPKGTGGLARVSGYTVAGKTGTARIAKQGGYEAKRHVGNFVGIAPTSKPRLVVAVVINDPQVGYYGGAVAAPVFSKVMAGALRIMNIPPDKAEATG